MGCCLWFCCVLSVGHCLGILSVLSVGHCLGILSVLSVGSTSQHVVLCLVCCFVSNCSRISPQSHGQSQYVAVSYKWVNNIPFTDWVDWVDWGRSARGFHDNVRDELIFRFLSAWGRGCWTLHIRRPTLSFWPSGTVYLIWENKSADFGRQKRFT